MNLREKYFNIIVEWFKTYYDFGKVSKYGIDDYIFTCYCFDKMNKLLFSFTFEDDLSEFVFYNFSETNNDINLVLF